MKPVKSHLINPLKDLLKKAARYRVVLFGLFLLAVYGYLGFQIFRLTTASPSADSVSGQLTVIQSPRVDTRAVDELKKLQDNSVEVKALFDQARNNPFQE